MTISSESRKAGPFTGNGVTTSFPFTFKVFEDSDLRVVRTTPTGAETDLALDSDYSVTLNPDQNATPGGTITYPLSGDPLPAGWMLTAVGNIQALQETDLTNQGGFYPQVIEDALDRATILIQQAEEQAGRTLRLPVSDNGAGIELPSAPSRAGKVLGFDASGVPQLVAVVEGSEVAIVNRQKFTATAAQTDFATSFSFTPGVNAVSVFLNGSKLVITDDYLELDDNMIRLNAGATLSDTVEVVSTGLAAGVADQVEQNAIAAGISEANAAASEAAATLSAASAAASANAAAGTYYVATKSAGDTLAATLPDAATVIVEADESQGGVRVRYTVASGVLTAGVVDTAVMSQFTQAGTGAVARTVQDRLLEVISVRDFGAVGDGVTDDTAAITAALTYANSLKRIGIVATIQHPGCTVDFAGGTYNVSSISTSFLVECNVRTPGAGVLVPAAYAGTVFTLGLTNSGELLATADINLPDVYKPTGSALVAGSTGVRIVNLNASKVRFGRIDYFDRARHFGGIGQGSVYCDFFLGQTAYANQIIRMVPGSGGWCNSNNFIGGNLRLGGNRVTGQFHVFMDGSSPATSVVGNNFKGTAFEGGGAEYVVSARNAYGNTFDGIYNETQGATTSVTVSGSTLTAVGHGLLVGDMVYLFATVLPTGMLDSTPYFVVSTPSADTFTISRNKGAAAITFSSAGTGVFFIRQSNCYFDGTTGAITSNNVFNDTFSPPSVSLNFIEVGQAASNGFQGVGLRYTDRFDASDAPAFRVRNSSGAAATRVGFAAYPTTVNPVTSPTLWTTGISDQGVMFQASGTEIGRLFSSSGILFYEGDNNGVLGQIPSGFRSPSLTTLGTTSVPANGRAIVTLTVTGASTGDYVVPHTFNALPDGIAIAWARVSAANSVQIAFHNWTGSPIDIAGAQLKALVYRSFY